MLKLFKRKPKGLDAKQRALEVIRVVDQTVEDWKNETDKFLMSHPGYSKERTKIIDEMQWIPYVSALTGILAASNFIAANETINSLIDLLSKSFVDGKQLEPEKLKRIKDRFHSYVGRFNRSIIFGPKAKSQDPMELLSQAISDCADEGIYYFTNSSRETFNPITKEVFFEKREPFGILENHVRETLMKYFMPFAKHFKKLGIV